ncbi:hypothetical protein PCANC_07469 [Puccinia coronata f. sp. avenae]|uniref:Uncharacterized protein n=1 Tax=Puccinia coronata f. sp. avenae TaxID=200324 RepID=A0A2N5VTF6_9BASI|nr:hypothetical protein PCANC_07469 [Puccinia coronata f. sp. avenae]
MRQESAPGSLWESIGAWSAAAGLTYSGQQRFPRVHNRTPVEHHNVLPGRSEQIVRPVHADSAASTQLDQARPPLLYRVQRALSATGHGAPLVANKRLPSSSARPSPPSAVNCSSPRAVALGVAPLGNMHIPIMYTMALFVPLVSATLPNWFPLKPAYSHLVVKHIGACDNKKPCQVILGGPCDICGCEIPRKKLFYQSRFKWKLFW